MTARQNDITTSSYVWKGHTVREYREQEQKSIPGTIAAKTEPPSYEVEIAPETPWRRHIDQLKSTVFAASPLSLPVLVPDKNPTVNCSKCCYETIQ